MDVDIGAIRGLRDELGELATDDAGPPGADTHRVGPEVIDAFRRYMALVDSAADAKVLGPPVFTEVRHRLLTAPFCPTLRGLVRQDTPASAIARAIGHVRAGFRSPATVPEVARPVGKSASILQ